MHSSNEEVVLPLVDFGDWQHSDPGPVYMTLFKNWNSSAAFLPFLHTTTAIGFSDAEAFNLWHKEGKLFKTPGFLSQVSPIYPIYLTARCLHICTMITVSQYSTFYIENMI